MLCNSKKKQTGKLTLLKIMGLIIVLGIILTVSVRHFMG